MRVWVSGWINELQHAWRMVRQAKQSWIIATYGYCMLQGMCILKVSIRSKKANGRTVREQCQHAQRNENAHFNTLKTEMFDSQPGLHPNNNNNNKQKQKQKTEMQ